MEKEYLNTFNKKEAEHDELINNLQKRTDDLLNHFERRKEAYAELVRNFRKTGKIDIKLGGNDINLCTDKENTDPLRNTNGVLQNKVKQVDDQTSANSSANLICTVTQETIKVEKDFMPAPTWIPPKKNVKVKTERTSVRTTRTKGRKAAASVRDSDVIIQDPVITTIDLSDSEDSDIQKQAKKVPVRSTRTKTRRAQVDSDTESDASSTSSQTKGVKNKKGDQLAKNNSEEQGTRTTRTKTLKRGSRIEEQIKKEEEVSEIRSTRTRTIRKHTKDPNNVNENEDDAAAGKVVEEIQEARNTRTKTVKKGVKSPENNNNNENGEVIGKTTAEMDKKEEIQETRSTRTKTIRKGVKDLGNNVEEEADKPQEIRSTRTRTTKKGVNLQDVDNQNGNINGEANTNNDEQNKLEDGIKKTNKKDDDCRNTFVKVDGNEEETVAKVPSNTQAKTTNKAEKKANGIKKTIHNKRTRNDSTDDERTEVNKKPKSLSPISKDEVNTTTHTEYEDARSTLGPLQGKNQTGLDATYVASKGAPTASGDEISTLNTTVTIQPKKAKALNSTVTLNKPNFNIFDKKSNTDLFTDDDSTEQIKTPKSPTMKEVFSPYAKTTLKKKVEAFEMLQNAKPKAKASSNIKPNTPCSVKEKAKLFTPLESKFLPSSSSTTSKLARLVSHQTSSVVNDSLLAMKSTQKDYRDKQKKMMEREQALKKKEAMLQAQAEARKKLNEEKQQKAQQQRKILEAEKQKQVELQKKKEERLKQREIEREEYLQKQKLELEKKRLAQKKKIQELQALQEQNKNFPTYMCSKLPRLPTEDCYDSDDPEYRHVTSPSWCTGQSVRIKQLAMLAAGENIKNTLFCRHAQTPNLVEIFEVIDPKKLKRSSSVIWKKPPRYTMMPDLNETKFSEDDELYCD